MKYKLRIVVNFVVKVVLHRHMSFVIYGGQDLFTNVYNSTKCKLEMDHIEANKSPTENAGNLEA